MKKTNVNKTLSLIVCIVLIAAMALFTIGCSDKKIETDGTSLKGGAVGEGDTVFTFTVVDADKNETKFEVSTDKTTVGEALLDAGLIAGEESSYGLYVQTVNGITLDFDKDGLYWAFYINDEYAQTGVDLTEIAEGEVYSFRAEE